LFRLDFSYLNLVHLPFAFWVIMGLAGVAVFAFLVFWKYRRW
jgi:hypothetical protein